MLISRLMNLIEASAASLTGETMQAVMTNEHTSSFRWIPIAELEPRIAALYLNLGKWVGDPQEEAVREEYEEWGRTRFRQRIPLSEIVYCLILAKAHLSRFIRDHGLVSFCGDRVTPDELVPVELYGIQELNYMIGEFFDRALYHLTRGYEAAATATRTAA
jgi:hypothetical protein